MRTGHRASLIGALVLMAGQTVALALFCFLVVPLLAGGLGPDDLEGAGAAAEARTVAFSIACGIAGAAVNAWVCHELGRALIGALPPRTALGRAAAAQAVTLVACLAGGATPLAVIVGPTLALLLACHLTVRERRGRRAAVRRGPARAPSRVGRVRP